MFSLNRSINYIQLRIRSHRIMMRKYKMVRARSLCHLDTCLIRSMTPAHFARVLLGGVHGISDQYIYVLEPVFDAVITKRNQFLVLIELWVVWRVNILQRFMIAGEKDLLPSAPMR